MSLIVVQRRRDAEFTITITESDGTNYTYVSADVIRIKIGREGAAPSLDLSSKAASDNGSSVTAANPCTLVLRAADITLLERGVYELEVSVVDDSDADKIKQSQSHVLCVIDSQTGGVSV